MANGMNLRPKEAAARLNVTVGHLANMRVKGNGPRFIKWGRLILYPLVELEAWEKKHLHTSVHVPAKG